MPIHLDVWSSAQSLVPRTQPLASPGRRPVVRVVAADAARASRLATLVSASGAEPRVAAGAGLSAATIGAPADAVLVVVEGFEAVAGQLPGMHLHLVALERSTAPALAGRAVVPAYAPGALEALLALVGERSSTERRREELEATLSALIDGESDGRVILDERGCVLLANEAAGLLLGVPVRPGQPLPVKVPTSGARVEVIEGAPICLTAESVPWGTETARILRVSSAAGDEEREGRLAHKDRLAAVGALAAGVAHEVNNPAQSVLADLTEASTQISTVEKGMTRLVDGLPEAAKEEAFALGLEGPLADSRQLVEGCISSLNRIASIVRDLKSFSRILPDRVDWVHPNEVVNQSCAMVNNHIRHRGRLVKDLGAFDAFPGDRNKLVQIITNLLVNAAQALPEDDPEARVLVRTRCDQGRVRISVIDTGSGIPDEVLRRIFEPFFTTKTDRDGTGLGLALSLDIARQHGGSLTVETEVGVGTRFDLVLPIDNGLQVRTTVVAETSEPELRSGRVLVVDDEPGILRSLGRLIGRNHEVVTCGHGRRALEVLLEDPRFDVVLCDLMMPDLDGPGLYEAVGRVAPHLSPRMVFMSGGAFTDRAQGFLESVRPVVLDKPAPASLLENTLQRVMARSIETAELPFMEPRGPPTRAFD